MTRNATDSYPVFARSERIADGVAHVVGVLFAVTGAILLILVAAGRADGPTIAAIAVYGGALIATFVASTLYHFTPWEGARPVFRRIDHAAIYLKIAGTYTPLVALVGGAFAWGLLAVVWVLAGLGALAKLFYWRDTGHWGTALYLGLGWLSLLLMWPLAKALPAGALALIVGGGAIYTIGALLFSLRSLRFQYAIWHGCVVVASGCMFGAIAWGALAA